MYNNRYFSKSQLQLENDSFELEIFKSISEASKENIDIIQQRRQDTEYTFVDFEGELKDQIYAEMALRTDNVFLIYKKEVDTILDFFGDIGGLLGIVTATGLLFTSEFVKRSMTS